MSYLSKEREQTPIQEVKKGISEKKCKEIRVSYKELGRLEQGYLL